MSTSPCLGVVVVSYNTRPLLARCLDRLLAESSGLATATDVWVVDNASTDGSPEMVSVDFPSVRLVVQGANLGFAAANNVVLARWLAEDTPTWVLLANPDTEARPGSLRTLIEALDGDPASGVVGPQLVYPDGRFQHSAFRFPGLGQVLLDLFPVPRLYDSVLNGRYPRARYSAGRPFEIDFPLGAFMMARGSAVARVGPMDEGFFMYCEEVDWCRRFRAAGYRNLCVPAATVVHHAGASTRQASDAMYVQLWRSRRRLFDKHGGGLRAGVDRRALRAAFRARAAADRWSVRRGRLDDSARLARAAAYEAIFAP